MQYSSATFGFQVSTTHWSQEGRKEGSIPTSNLHEPQLHVNDFNTNLFILEMELPHVAIPMNETFEM